ncbi:histidine phosphatase family protein [Bacillus thuringiensis]|uniref:Phosphoglycerate mutase n=1 Tax=Bacillus thuringiensis HD-771 TaxID=1218175 RepID=A0A9W3NX70_BACTU|nr:histidine phosphatase family protein [Bacillus thuringiensis]AFQ15655.1 phosphoglycerate mutase [Bacillus thuringiensis HD-771]MEB4892958.1 histidine phosphatase family protein [Bacillus thuringiensis]MEC2474982.1 histidine phosphatase family protein [Bacillus thuringiensis]MEC2564682.1 histidine phosphatase family protein [Bacillus thuringiensis]MEC2645572.1 histidine phosphatase family protein [Bacillus thuringiensis]
MIKLYLVRHGETEGITLGRMESRKDSPLTNMGILQIKSLKQRLQDEKIDYIYTSPSGRALKTAEIINTEHPITLLQDNRLYEMDIGDWDGLTQQEIQNEDSCTFEQFLHSPESYKPQNKESFYDVLNRVETFISYIISKHDNQNILIVSHTAVLSLMRCFFKSQNIEHVWDKPKFQNGSLSLVNYEDDKYSITLDADITHLNKISIL